ncbi:ATP-binding protein [Bacillus weihaiensis]|uniref:YhaN AAA domain-containing protein n=1 Tax=Bacillus weihaiensis TaxID=1547283 RepID=A0A1L3MUP8_9BACI|nr:AAA family ATPase [Bacillus weihaiensis]APH06067.1 hypothetical protein A9C19_15690 [Bacillus weihaiensis]
MKIKELMIYGYGRFEKTHIVITDDQLQIVYGENEAGKSTLMSFIHSILFGFPTKQQAEKRYEPKQGGAYGGYLLIEKNGEALKVERLPGKNGGTVTIKGEDGSDRGEDFLQELVSGIDKETYRSIFSFDVHGLQQVQKISGSQLGKYLFLSSIYGADSLFAIEDKLSKEQDALFKPSGKRPLLNEGLEKLKGSSKKLLEAKKQNHDYTQLLSKKEKLEKEIADRKSKRMSREVRLRELEKVRSVLPLLTDREWCLNQVAALPPTGDFPENGLTRLEQFIVTLQQKEAELHTLQKKRESLLLEENQLDVEEKVLDAESEIKQLRDQLPLYEEKKKRVSQLNQTIDQLNLEMNLHKQQLFPSLTEDEILSIHATLPVKEEIKQAVITDQQFKHRKQMIDEQFEQTKNELEACEEKMRDITNQLLPEKERQKLDEQMKSKDRGSIHDLKSEKQRISSQIETYKEDRKKQMKQQTTLFLIFSGILFVLFASSLFGENWLLAGISLAGCVAVLFYLGSRKKQKHDPFLTHLLEQAAKVDNEIREVEEQVATVSFPSYEDLNRLLERDDFLRRSLDHEKLVFAQLEKSYDRILKQYEEWEDEKFHSSERYVKLLSEFPIGQDTNPGILLEAFDQIQSLQQLIIKKQQYLADVKATLEEVNHYESRVGEVTEKLQMRALPIEKAVYDLVERYEWSLKNKEKKITIQDRREEVEESIEIYLNENQFIKQQKQELLESSQATSDEEYRKLWKVQQERQELLKQQKWIEKQLVLDKNIDLEKVTLVSSDELNKEIEEIEGQIRALEEEEEELQHHYSKTSVQILEIEKSGTYSTLRHDFETEKETVRDHATQWVVKSLAKELLHQTIERHRNQKLPEALDRISHYFRSLTSDTYHRVILPSQSDSFLVEREDGQTFYAEELSQATAEQLYLSIRLAMVKNMNKQLSLPIIMDDSFVHFDHKRSKNTFLLLEELKQDNQVIFFTCHQHLTEFHHQSGTLTLTR